MRLDTQPNLSTGLLGLGTCPPSQSQCESKERHTAACAAVEGIKGCCCGSWQPCCPSHGTSGHKQAFTGPTGSPGVLPLPPADVSPALLFLHPLHCVSCEQGSLSVVRRAVLCVMGKGLDCFVKFYVNSCMCFFFFFPIKGGLFSYIWPLSYLNAPAVQAKDGGSRGSWRTRTAQDWCHPLS